MLKAVIIDDEYYFRESLKKIISWKELGVDIAGEANNGEDALELIMSSNPDIAFVDINMPVINGLELIEKIREQRSSIEIVIISGYSDFEFAQKAIQYGVTNYLLKPVVKNELRSGVKTLTERIYLKRQDAKKVDRIIHSRRIRNLLTESSKEYLPEQLNSSELFRVVAMDISLESLEHVKRRDREQLSSELKMLFDGISDGTILAQAAFDSNGYFTFIVGSSVNSPNETQYLKHCISMLSSKIKEQFEVSVWSGIGRIHSGPEKISKSYHEALIVLKNQKLHEVSAIEEYEENVGPSLNYNIFGENANRALFREIRSGNSPEVGKRIDKLFRVLQQNRAPEQLIKAYAFDIILTAVEFCSREKILEQKINDLNGMFGKLDEAFSIGEMRELVLSMILSLADAFSGPGDDRDNMIHNMKTYILENVYDPGFGIQDIADRFRLNYHYTCTLFKNITGETLNSFISDIRLTKAQEMLKETDNSISSIAFLCGYKDQYYFSRVFRKHFGFPPSKMR